MKKIIIEKEKSGQRIDKFLMREIFCNEKISRGDIIRKIRSGKITVNKKIIKPSYILKENDEVRVEIGDRESETGLFSSTKIKIKIIENNKNFLVIDKPAGIQTHVDAHEKKNTVVNWLVAKYPEIKNIHDKSREAELRPGIVHRLDKDTSGVMVIAKNQKTFDALKTLFKNRKIKKTYVAIVHGILEEKAGAIESSLAKSTNYKKQTIASSRTKTKIRSAFTGYRVLEEFKSYSLIEVYLKTGRTHQIRIHLWSIGHPIVGDTLYKRKNKIALIRTVNRQLLHAEKLSFKLSGKSYSFEVKMPKDMQDFLKGRGY